MAKVVHSDPPKALRSLRPKPLRVALGRPPPRTAPACGVKTRKGLLMSIGNEHETAMSSPYALDDVLCGVVQDERTWLAVFDNFPRQDEHATPTPCASGSCHTTLPLPLELAEFAITSPGIDGERCRLKCVGIKLTQQELLFLRVERIGCASSVTTFRKYIFGALSSHVRLVPVKHQTVAASFSTLPARASFWLRVLIDICLCARR